MGVELSLAEESAIPSLGICLITKIMVLVWRATTMDYTKKCQCEHTEYTISIWTIQLDYRYRIECTCGIFIQLATQEDVEMYNERYKKNMEYKSGYIKKK